MTQKAKSGPAALSQKLREAHASWEHQEKTVYTVEALEREMTQRLVSKKDSSKKENSGD
jgi:hypothetical protein